VPITSITGTNAVEIIIDGGAPTVIDNVSGTSFTTPSGLAKGAHTVEIRKKSEALFGSVFIGKPTTDGTLTAVSSPAKRIEIIGDSISVGYGLDGVYPCTNTASLEDAPKTYGALTADAIGADWSIVAWSGKGLIRNYASGTVDTSPLMPELWTRYGANDADNTYDFKTPVTHVVINLGTNDFGYLGVRDPINPANFTSALVTFTKQVQSKYPSAQIFITSSPMLSDSYPTAQDAQHTTQSTCIKNAVSQIGSKAHFVDFPTQGSDVGCDYHPNAATHAQLASILTSAIQAAGS
jgi:lysophospholipase L1-like esterase